MPILMSMPCPHVLLLIHHTSTSRLAYHIHMPWHHTLNPTLNLHCPCVLSSSLFVNLVFSLFYFSFLFLFCFIFYFLFLEQLELELIGHAVTLVTTWWHSHKTDHKTWENLVEDSRTNDIIQHGHHMLVSRTTHGCLG